MERPTMSPPGAVASTDPVPAPTDARSSFRLIVLAVLGTPVLAALGWIAAWRIAYTLPGVPDWDGTFTWAPLAVVFLGPALVVLALLAAPAWVRPHDAAMLRTARLLVVVGCQALVVFLFGFVAEWWRTGGFPPTAQVVTLELIASAVTLIPSVLLLRKRDDGTSRGWRAAAMVAPALLIVLAMAVGSATHGVPPYNPAGMPVVVAQSP
jgi:hypothetical protein